MRWGCNHFHKTSFEPAVCIVLMSKLGQLSSHFIHFWSLWDWIRGAIVRPQPFPVMFFPLPLLFPVPGTAWPVWRWSFQLSDGEANALLTTEVSLSLKIRSVTSPVLWAAGIRVSISGKSFSTWLPGPSGSGAPIHWNPWWKDMKSLKSSLSLDSSCLALSVSSKVEALGKRFVSWDRLCTHSFSAKVRGASLGHIP